MSQDSAMTGSCKNLDGLKILGRFGNLFAHPRLQDCDRGKAGNRTFHFDPLACLVMVAMSNAIVEAKNDYVRHIRDNRQVEVVP